MNKVFYKNAQNMSEVKDNCVDLIVTSPPYFNIKDYAKDGYQELIHAQKNNEQLGDLEDYQTFILELLKVWKECERVLKPNGKLAINVPLMPMKKSVYSTHYNRDIFDLNADIQHSILYSEKSKMYLYDTYIWHRTNSAKKLMFGSYPYPRNFYAQNTSEFISIYVKDGQPQNSVAPDIKEASKLTEEEWVTYTKQIWSLAIPAKDDMAYGKHSAIMPEEIVRRCVKMFTFVGDCVLDPFAGSGTTLKVAKEEKRSFIGYEVMPSYADIIEAKLDAAHEKKEATAQPNLFATNDIYEADCFSFLSRVQDKSVDLAIIDPPYNIGRAEWDRFNSDEEFFDFTFSWIDALIEKLNDTASLYIFNTPYNAAFILTHLVKKGLHFRNWITWDKRDGFSASKKKFNNGQETVLFFTKSDHYTFNCDEVRIPYESTERIKHAQKKGILKNGKRWFPNENGKLCGEVWHFASERHQQKENGKVYKLAHETPKPTALIERIIKASSNEGDVILDCFVGIGTTAFAAHKLNRKFLCGDKDGQYIKIAKEKIKNVSR